jgi:hypothetical protein
VVQRMERRAQNPSPIVTPVTSDANVTDVASGRIVA